MFIKVLSIGQYTIEILTTKPRGKYFENVKTKLRHTTSLI